MRNSKKKGLLLLNRSTISNLSHSQMDRARGGETDRYWRLWDQSEIACEYKYFADWIQDMRKNTVYSIYNSYKPGYSNHCYG